MKKYINLLNNWFYRFPVIVNVCLSLVLSFFVALVFSLISLNDFKYFLEDLISRSWLFTFGVFPVVLTIENIHFLLHKQDNKEKIWLVKKLEIFGTLSGFIFFLLIAYTDSIYRSDWQVQLDNSELHTPIATGNIPTIIVISLIAFSGFIYLRFVNYKKQPPLMTVLGISAMYLGIALCVVWCIQVCKNRDELLFLSCLYQINLIIMAIRSIRDTVIWKLKDKEENPVPAKQGRLASVLGNAANLPWLGFLLAVPLLGVIVAVLILFGQEPDSIIKAWTETADWTFSQKTAPPNVIHDEHYLCTVAAGGHEKIVKPLRTGKRHGHEVIVNRQLCIANAFEELIQEKTPAFHKNVRGLYDKTGYPIAKHIKSKYVADVVYIIMKPLEWFFMIVLYLFDSKPENRIAVQYPHTAIPTLNKP